jgi:hypothetical protein
MALSPAEIVAPARLSTLPPLASVIALESPVIEEKLVTDDPATDSDIVSENVAEIVPRLVKAHALAVAEIARFDVFDTETPGKTSTVLPVSVSRLMPVVTLDVTLTSAASALAAIASAVPAAPIISSAGRAPQIIPNFTPSSEPAPIRRITVAGHSPTRGMTLRANPKQKRLLASFLKYRPRHPSKQREIAR